jgi:group I intron endonuclease
MHISPTNKYYIGITSQNIEKRWQNGYGYKTNKHFWRAIQKYGWDNFEHKILKRNLTKTKAEELEIYYIQKYNSQVPNGYNVELGGKNCPKPKTQEQKELLT